MSDNVIKSTDVTSAKAESNPVKKAPAKKAAAKPKAEKKDTPAATGLKVIIFESGASYVSGGIFFTREDNIKEVSEDQADFLLTLDNFRAPNQLELEDYLNSKED
jgi:hypothetical protein